MPKSYPPEFSRRVIELVGAGGSASAVARDLGVSDATIYRWIAREEVDLGERPGLRSGGASMRSPTPAVSSTTAR